MRMTQNDADTYADDLAELFKHLDLNNATLKIHPAVLRGLPKTHEDRLNARWLSFLKD